MTLRTRLAAAVGGCLGLALVLAVTPTARAATSTPVTGGSTAITFAGATVSAAHDAGIRFVAISPASQQKSVLTLPTVDGTMSPPDFHVRAAGGFSVTKGSKTVRLTHLVVDTGAGTVTADLTGQGRVVALRLGEPNAGSGGPGRVQYQGYSVTLTSAAISVLDKILSTSAFAAHRRLGTATLTVLFKA